MKTGIQCVIPEPRKIKDGQQAIHSREWETRGCSLPPFHTAQDPSLGNGATHSGQVSHLSDSNGDNSPWALHCSSSSCHSLLYFFFRERNMGAGSPPQVSWPSHRTF